MIGGGLDGTRRIMGQETLRAKSSRATLRRLTGYFRKYWLLLLGVLAMIIYSAWAQVTAPELIGQAVDCFIVVTPASAQACWFTATPGPNLAGFTQLILILVALFVSGAIIGGLTFYSMNWAGQHVLVRLRQQVFRQIHRLSLGYYTVHEAGDVMSRLTNDVDTIQQAMTFGLVQVLSGTLLIVWLVVVMVRTNVAYALLSLTVLPFMLAATTFLSGQARKAFRQSRIEMGSVNADLQESISGVREAQAFSREDENIESFRRTNAANRAANVRAVRYTSAMAPSLEFMSFVSLAIVVGVGGLWSLRGTPVMGTVFTLGLVVTFLGYVQRLNQPVQQIAVLWTNLQNALAGSERIFDFLDGVPDVLDRPGAQAMPAIQGLVRFEDVWAGYEVDRPVLRGVSLEAKPGQTIAIVGPTGAGKTTIINLLPRFWDVSGGRVTIDGIDVRDVTQESLHTQIGIVLQDTFLFSDTVLNNIRYGRPDASDEETMAAARLVQADGFIERLPNSYQTVLGERGGGLSQGQRQLIAIARAALVNPRILILDEATSSVDTRTERLIQAALETLMAGRTSFVIAHRLSTIRHSDEVLVVDNGQIVERGTHDALLANQGPYFALYTSQFMATAEGAPDSVATAGVPAAALLAAAPAVAAALAGGGGLTGYPSQRNGAAAGNGSEPSPAASAAAVAVAQPERAWRPLWPAPIWLGAALGASVVAAALALGIVAAINGGSLKFAPVAAKPTPAVGSAIGGFGASGALLTGSRTPTAVASPSANGTSPAAELTAAVPVVAMPIPSATVAPTASPTGTPTTGATSSPTVRSTPRPSPTLRILGR